MQKEILQENRLLDENGNLKECGYSKKMLLQYSRADIKVRKTRIKEWDYYLIHNNEYAVALTIADNGYMGMLSASLIDFKNGKEITKSKMTFMPKGKFNLPPTSTRGDIEYDKGSIELEYKHTNNGRSLEFEFENFDKKQDFECEFKLTDEPAESMVIATPFKKPKHFYYNQKIIGMKAKGKVKFGNVEIVFDDKNSVALLDWGRGVWTYKNTWYWGAGMGYVNGKSFGFNIGYGFGDTSAASENMLFYNGKAHKLEDVTFNIPKNQKGKFDYLKPWTFSSSDGRFEMDFVPILDRKSKTDILIICSDQHQVFGRFSGTAILDDGTKITIKDFLGFAERVFNKW